LYRQKEDEVDAELMKSIAGKLYEKRDTCYTWDVYYDNGRTVLVSSGADYPGILMLRGATWWDLWDGDAPESADEVPEYVWEEMAASCWAVIEGR
jgi:hypothetical protein